MPPLDAKPAAETSLWEPYAPDESAPWNLQRVVHLHRRAAFAAPWDVLQRDLADGPKKTVDRLLKADASDDPPFVSLANTIGDAAMASGSAGRVQAWWFYRMLVSPDPLGERLTLMWHNHFATSNRKVQNLVLMREQNELLREHARAPFGELLASVVKHPAMLVWLDADSNRKGRANENLAREMLELFTLGVDNYSEEDVKEAARALTGWTVVSGRFEYRESRHDDDEMTLFGEVGNFTGDDLLDQLLEHPAAPRRLAWRICHTLLGEGVASDEALAELAAGLSAHGLNVAWAVETMLRSRLFFSAESLRSHVLGPVEYIVGALNALELIDPPPSTLLLADWATRMGQELFYPPSVGGWSEGLAWLGSRYVVARANFAAALTGGELWHPRIEPDFAALVAGHVEGDRLEDCAVWLAELLWGEADAEVIDELVAASSSASSADSHAVLVASILARPEHHLG